MPLLAMTADGELYETSSHRDDGKGFRRGSMRGFSGDVCLGSAVALAETERNLELQNRQRAEIQARVRADKAARARKAFAGQERIRQKAYAEERAVMNARSGQKDKLLLEALAQTKGDTLGRVGLSGWGSSANGRQSSLVHNGFGDFLSDLLNKGEQAIASAVPGVVTQAIENVTGMDITPDVPAPAPAPTRVLPAPVASIVKAATSGKILGMSPLMLVGGVAVIGAAAFFLMRKK